MNAEPDSMKLETPGPGSRLFEEAKALGDRETKKLGFLPTRRGKTTRTQGTSWWLPREGNCSVIPPIVFHEPRFESPTSSFILTPGSGGWPAS